MKVVAIPFRSGDNQTRGRGVETGASRPMSQSPLEAGTIKHFYTGFRYSFFQWGSQSPLEAGTIKREV